jgi:flavodoxin
MKTIVIYYSLTGKTAVIAKEKSKVENADLLELKDLKKFGLFKAFVFGAFKAIRQKKAKLKPFVNDFDQYDKIIFAMPIWGSMPAPAINNVIENLPAGKDIELILTSSGGDSKGASIKVGKAILAKRCNLIKTTDIKTA